MVEGERISGSAEPGAVAAATPWRRLGHIPQLDGLRGIAVLLTVAAHSKLLVFEGGGSIGVTLFFVLSGFLITSLLLQEWQHTGSVSLRNFYTRRALRLMPALWLVIVVYVILAFVAFNPIALGDRLKAAFFTGTFFGNWQNATGGHLAQLSHTWSLAVEDQFYFLWPPVLLLALRRGSPRAWIVAGCVAVAVGLIALRAAAYLGGVDWHRIYYGTDMVGSALLMGCLTGLAYTWRAGPVIEGVRANVVAVGGFVAILVSANLLHQHSETGRAALALVGFPAVSIISAITIYVVALDRSAARFLGNAVLRYFGRISYGLYLWHLFVIHILGLIFGLPESERSFWSIPLAIAAAAASYHLVETPFLRLKLRVAPAPGQATTEEASVIGVAAGPLEPSRISA